MSTLLIIGLVIAATVYCQVGIYIGIHDARSVEEYKKAFDKNPDYFFLMLLWPFYLLLAKGVPLLGRLIEKPAARAAQKLSAPGRALSKLLAPLVLWPTRRFRRKQELALLPPARLVRRKRQVKESQVGV